MNKWIWNSDISYWLAYVCLLEILKINTNLHEFLKLVTGNVYTRTIGIIDITPRSCSFVSIGACCNTCSCVLLTHSRKIHKILKTAVFLCPSTQTAHIEPSYIFHPSFHPILQFLSPSSLPPQHSPLELLPIDLSQTENRSHSLPLSLLSLTSTASLSPSLSPCISSHMITPIHLFTYVCVYHYTLCHPPRTPASYNQYTTYNTTITAPPFPHNYTPHLNYTLHHHHTPPKITAPPFHLTTTPHTHITPYSTPSIAPPLYQIWYPLCLISMGLIVCDRLFNARLHHIFQSLQHLSQLTLFILFYLL